MCSCVKRGVVHTIVEVGQCAPAYFDGMGTVRPKCRVKAENDKFYTLDGPVMKGETFIGEDVR